MTMPESATPMDSVQIVRADYGNAEHGRALVDMLDAYARDPAGGGHALTDFTRGHLVADAAVGEGAAHHHLVLRAA